MIWDLTETIDPKILQGHDGAVVALDVSASGCHTVVSGSCDRCVVGNSSLTFLLNLSHTGLATMLVPVGLSLHKLDQDIEVVGIENGELLRTFKGTHPCWLPHQHSLKALKLCNP